MALRDCSYEQAILWGDDRIHELEAENKELIDVNIYEHGRAEAAESKLRAVGELPRHRMDIIEGNYYPVVDQARGEWVRFSELKALLKEKGMGYFTDDAGHDWTLLKGTSHE